MTVLVTPSALGDRKVREFEMLIDGRPSKGAEGRTLERIAPGHGIAVSRYQAADGSDAERAIAAARKAFDDGPLPRMTAAERSRILLTVAAMIDARADELHEAGERPDQEAGRPEGEEHPDPPRPPARGPPDARMTGSRQPRRVLAMGSRRPGRRPAVWSLPGDVSRERPNRAAGQHLPPGRRARVRPHEALRPIPEAGALRR